MGLLNLVFIFFSDIVLLSLREQTIEIQGKESRNFFIYDPFFQVITALFVRLILCFIPSYWLMTYSMIFFIIQLISAFDLSQTILINLAVIRDEQKDIMKIYEMAPLLQAKTQSQIPELKCFISKKKTHDNSCMQCLIGSKTQLI